MNTIDDMYTKVKQYAKYTLHIAIAVGLLVTANSTHRQYKEHLVTLTDTRCPAALSIPRSWRDTIIQVNLVTGPLNERICFDYLSKNISSTTSLAIEP
jgi:uncharacterized membrane protein